MGISSFSHMQTEQPSIMHWSSSACQKGQGWSKFTRKYLKKIVFVKSLNTGLKKLETASFTDSKSQLQSLMNCSQRVVKRPQKENTRSTSNLAIISRLACAMAGPEGAAAYALAGPAGAAAGPAGAAADSYFGSYFLYR